MKKGLLYINIAFFLLGSMPSVFAQENSNFDSEFSAIDKELTNWDAVRGKWLGSSLKAMSVNQPIPDRTFPEDFSPAEMMRLVPANTMNNVRLISQTQSQNSRDLLVRERWSKIYNYTNRPTCKLVMGRTYGDPHLKSFDGASYSFQTVGEFVLTSANNGQFEVQVRQEPQRDDFSLNTGVAMKVGGDRLGIYARDNNDAFNSSVMLNGMPLEIGSRTYYLPHGGTIRNSGRNYLVTWPSGETVSVDMSRTGGMPFMNLAVQVYPCASTNYSGLMGNANGDRRDDFDTDRTNSRGSVFASGSMSDNFEKERLAFLAKDFANAHRISSQRSLFDYSIGQNTVTFTDYSYPRVHRTLNDIPSKRRTDARNICAASGLTGNDLDACIYDQAFLNIEPIRPPVIIDRTDRVILGRVDRETPNINPTRETPKTNNSDTREVPNGSSISRPLKEDSRVDERIGNDVKIESGEAKWDSREVEERTTVNTSNESVVRPVGNSTSKEERVEKVSSSESNPNTVTSPERTEPTPQTKVVKTNPRVVSPKEVPKPIKVVKPKTRTPTKIPTSIPVPKKTVPSPSRIGG
jgi:hypothetical protein